ncbi:MAG: hypothetical protein ACYSWW_23240, partial [Planctomycetota bacterium]
MKSRLTVSLGCVSALILCTFVQAVEPSFADGKSGYVITHWEREFAELEKQIKETGELYNRGHDPYEGMRILDGDSRILPSDCTPFDVEYRRTHALIDLLEDKYDVRTLGSLRARLSQIGKRIKSRRGKSGAASRIQAMSDYFEAAALRRAVAMSNPLLNFDTLLFVGRGNYYGDDPTGQHQISGPLAFCNRVGGGLYMVKNFKTNPKIIDVLEGSIVEKGSYKG